MKVSAAIKALQDIHQKFGDIAITGGALSEDEPLSNIIVTDKGGVSVYPTDNRKDRSAEIEMDGVFLT
ncbi:MAG: hypothetical protein ABJN42_03535 [Roseibium sp.]|uniref:hypothetical protein n=1 Tax=Roseibium sp. TaxID=1936156 RepID=UPI0032981C2D